MTAPSATSPSELRPRRRHPAEAPEDLSPRPGPAPPSEVPEPSRATTGPPASAPTGRPPHERDGTRHIPGHGVIKHADSGSTDQNHPDTALRAGAAALGASPERRAIERADRDGTDRTSERPPVARATALGSPPGEHRSSSAVDTALLGFPAPRPWQRVGRRIGGERSRRRTGRAPETGASATAVNDRLHPARSSRSSRSAARADPDGLPVPLHERNRGRWDPPVGGRREGGQEPTAARGERRRPSEPLAEAPARDRAKTCRWGWDERGPRRVGDSGGGSRGRDGRGGGQMTGSLGFRGREADVRGEESGPARDGNGAGGNGRGSSARHGRLRMSGRGAAAAVTGGRHDGR
ncbi:hypothetical protein EDD29_6631 [Actinocorallia herbida]|uniref:Uncharacterized protein n=1 Tax=Actinocorallia herbida TaxID=58109 RepID=A0A3N1D5Y0_9ACTN|nr:hypothetical protein EDD29_6631 [Actinocorallia herbida]